MAALTLYPAIDLQEGRCVRLRQGDLQAATVYSEDPAQQARTWQSAGFDWIHVVDLDGAVSGRPMNRPAVEGILDALGVPVQLGGGIRDRDTLEAWLEAGVRRIILGTAALRNPKLVREAAKAHPGRIAVGIDARDGRVAVQGWAENSEMTALDLAKAFEDAGVAAVIYTDIARDGMLSGVNVQATAELAKAVSIPVIASGGVSDIEDIRRVKTAADEGVAIDGLVVGRALYDGRIDPAQALALARG